MVVSRDFFQAIKEGDVAHIEEMIEKDRSLVNARGENGPSALLTAVYYRKAAVAELLVAHGAELDLFEAAAVGRVERVHELVIADPAVVNAVAPDGFQPLGLAAFFGHLTVVEYLLAHGAEVNSASNNPMRVMPLHSAVAGRYLEIARALLEHGADVNARQAEDYTPLIEAAQNGQREMVELLLDFGADKNARRADGQTASSIAQDKGFGDLAEILAT